jgi:hypothetical protein
VTYGNAIPPRTARPSSPRASRTGFGSFTSPSMLSMGRSLSPSRSGIGFVPTGTSFAQSRNGESTSPRASPRTTPMRAPTATVQVHTYGEEDPDNLSLIYDATFGSQVCGATSLLVKSESQVLDVLRLGATNRAIAATSMNETSSRSHCIVILTILQDSVNGVRGENGVPSGERATRYSKLYFVDLAGSERPAKSKVSGVQLQETQAINSSLSALGSVINALANGNQHVPYRDAKLTRLLQDGLGFNCRTALVVNVSPSSYNADESKSLRFGATASRIKSKATSNLLNPVEAAKKVALSRLQRAK